MASEEITASDREMDRAWAFRLLLALMIALYALQAIVQAWAFFVGSGCLSDLLHGYPLGWFEARWRSWEGLELFCCAALTAWLAALGAWVRWRAETREAWGIGWCGLAIAVALLVPIDCIGPEDGVGAFFFGHLCPRACDKCCNFTSAEKALMTLVDAEHNFMKADYDNDGKNFAYDLDRLYATKDADGNLIQLIPVGFSSLSNPPNTKEGYLYGTLGTYDEQGGSDRRFGFAYYAVPAIYGTTGRRSYIVNQRGRVWYKLSTGGRPPPCWPRGDPAHAGWIRLRD